MHTETWAKRKSCSLTFKLAFIKSAKSSSNASTARSHNVDESMVRRWRRNEASLVVVEKTKVYRGIEFLDLVCPVAVGPSSSLNWKVLSSHGSLRSVSSIIE